MSQKKDFASVGTQTEIPSRDFVSSKILKTQSLESELFPHIMVKSHSITLLLLWGAFVAYMAIYAKYDQNNFIDNSVRGVMFAAFSLIFFGLIFFKDSIFQRPHPSFWRMVQGIGLCYSMMLSYCLFLSRDDMQYFLKTFFDSNLGKPLENLLYGADCRVFTPENPESQFYNIYHSLDCYIFAHFFGWWGKMLIVRDYKMCLLLSVLFELIELSLKHWLVNFNECWWDQLILDLILCNGIGIYFGHLTIQYFQMKEQHFFVKNIKPSNKSPLKKVVEFFFTPNYEKFEWHVFRSTKEFVAVLFYIIVTNVIDLSHFFNKYALHITPSNHNILFFRVVLQGFMAIISTREYIESIQSDWRFRLGANVWLQLYIMFLEYAIFFKNIEGIIRTFDVPTPTHIILIWSVILTIIGIILIRLIQKDIKSYLSNK